MSTVQRAVTKQPIDEVLESLTRTVRMNEETIQIAHGTAEALHKQGEQIRRIVGKVTQIDREVDVADTEVSKIASFSLFGFWDRFCKLFSTTRHSEDVEREGVRAVEQGMREVREAEPKAPRHEITISHDPVDTALNIVQHQVDELLEKAIAFRDELTEQNAMLDVAAEAATVADTNLERTTRYVRRLY
jgi:uncharacterized protein YoxC